MRSTGIFILLAVTALRTQAECYRRRSNSILTAPAMHVCLNAQAISPSGAQQCCLVRKDGQCGSDQLCRDADLNYYIGGCTDSSFADPACRNECSELSSLLLLARMREVDGKNQGSYPTTYISWDTNQLRWNCCGDTGASDSGVCNGTVTGESFEAVAPSSWTAVSDTVGTSTMTTLSSSTATSTADVKQAQPGAGFSQTAAIGVGVGATLGGIAVLAALGWWVLRCRRERREKHNGEQAKAGMEMETSGLTAGRGISAEDEAVEVDSNLLHEMGGMGKEREKRGHGGMQSLGELPGGEYAREVPAEVPVGAR